MHLMAVLALSVAGFAAIGGAAPPPGKGGGKDKVTFEVSVVNPEATLYDVPTYLPTCTATSGGNNSYTALFDRHDLCATVTTSTGYQLTDDIVIQVNTTQGLITSVQLRGQDVIGEEGIMHESETVAITPPVTPSTSGFTLHVHVDNLPIWKLTRHLGGSGWKSWATSASVTWCTRRSRKRAAFVRQLRYSSEGGLPAASRGARWSPVGALWPPSAGKSPKLKRCGGALL
jgi:hypothetical protein